MTKAAEQKAKEVRERGFGEELQQYIRTCLVSPGALLRLPVLLSAAKTACASGESHTAY